MMRVKWASNSWVLSSEELVIKKDDLQWLPAVAPIRYLSWASETSARPLSCVKKMVLCLGERLDWWR